jgi:CubicO group peptidase (beta-lactamase class C family)
VPDWDYSHNFAGGNMLSTAQDLVRLGAALQAPGYLTRTELARLETRPTLQDGSATQFSYGWSVSKAGAERLVSMTGSNAGVQAGLFSYPERRLAVSVLANAWGIGSGSGEFVSDLPKRLADLCSPPPVSVAAPPTA